MVALAKCFQSRCAHAHAYYCGTRSIVLILCLDFVGISRGRFPSAGFVKCSAAAEPLDRLAALKRLEFEFRVVDQFLNLAVFLTITPCVLLLADQTALN